MRDDEDALIAMVQGARPTTIRHTFYLAEVAGVVHKTEASYDQVGRDLLRLRRSGRMPYSWISDTTRWMRKPSTFSDVEDALDHASATYRRALWDEQTVYVEVWCEKDTVAGLLSEVTREFDVPLMVSRGFTSETYLYEAAEQIKAQGKPAFLYYAGDFDPSGVLVDRSIEKKLRGFAPEAEIHFERVTVRPEQIEAWGLRTRPTKRKNNSHAKGFLDDRSVELEAVHPNQLRQLIRDCIERHIDRRAVDQLRVAERSEREIFARLMDYLPLAQEDVSGGPADEDDFGRGEGEE